MAEFPSAISNAVTFVQGWGIIVKPFVGNAGMPQTNFRKIGTELFSPV